MLCLRLDIIMKQWDQERENLVQFVVCEICQKRITVTCKMIPCCREVWWSPDQTPGEVLGPDGEPEGQESWLCLSPSLWSLPAEVTDLLSGRLTDPEIAHSIYSLINLLLLFFLNVYRYKPLCPETWPNWHGRLADGVSTLVNHLGYKAEEYKLGR